MVLRPSGIVFVNNDLTTSVQAMLVTQLHITEVIDGDTFDARIAADSTYPATINQLDLRIMVVRPFTELTNRDLADVVIWVSHGLASIEENKFGPPNQTFPVLNLTWGQLSIF